MVVKALDCGTEWVIDGHGDCYDVYHDPDLAPIEVSEASERCE
jgi:hypothetical protein